jgi:CBS domain-containing protein
MSDGRNAFAVEAVPDDRARDVTRAERLVDARQRMLDGEAYILPVRELLQWWGFARRGPRVVTRVETELAEVGLATSPNFRKVGLDTWIALVTDAATERVAPTEDEPGDWEVGLTVGNVPSALDGVESIPPDATFDEAIAKMLLNDYSQLAVMATPYSLKGAVTWRSIAQARDVDREASFASARVHAPVVRYDEELLDILPTLSANDFVLVRGPSGGIEGIVTAADVVREYSDLATPFILIGELDQLLRRLIERRYTIEQVQACCSDGDRDLETFDDMTFGDYIRVLETPAHCSELNWSLHRGTVIGRLEEIRTIRNDVMHFNPDPVPPEAVPMLRNLINLLRGYGA